MVRDGLCPSLTIRKGFREGRERMHREQLKRAAIAAIDCRKDELLAMGDYLIRHAETGYREFNTSAYMKTFMQKEGLLVQDRIAVTGLKAVAKGKSDKANVAFFAELDALNMPAQKYAVSDTGAAHACGHHVQLVCMAGVIIGLISTGIYKEFDGDLTFLVTPAEEIIDLDYRKELIQKGLLSYIGGKQNFIDCGAIDAVDCILGCHAGTYPEASFAYGHHFNGVIAKNISFHGKSAHSGKCPELGINALHAAVNAINNINALRERFRDEDHIRVHYIITKGGDSVNIIPDDVRMEMCVRGYSAEAMCAADKLVNEAIRMGAASIGATVDIQNVGGYLPLNQNADLGKVFHDNVLFCTGGENARNHLSSLTSASTDAGDFSALKPTLMPYIGGATGALHTVDWDVIDPNQMYVEASKAFAATLIDLLCDGAEKAREIAENDHPLFCDKDEYNAFLQELLK